MDKFRVVDQLSDSDVQSVRSRLRSYNLERLEDKKPQELGVFLDDEKDDVVAGLIGETHGLWLEVEYLCVDQAHRKNGIGSKLLAQAEEEARSRGCKFAFLNTFGFQAPGFYLKHGYRQVFALEQYPVTGKRHYYIKEL